jgi:hypothetical protein
MNDFIREQMVDEPGLPTEEGEHELVFNYGPAVELLYPDGRTLRGTNLTAWYTLTNHREPIDAVAGRVYAEDGRPIGQEIAFRYQDHDTVVHHRALIVRGEDGKPDVTSYRRSTEPCSDYE